ncbi:MAG: peptidoglycan DD-metalloendopeptidase family protein [Ectothiorhodospiraceae bacterium]|nr:peptidoglycan DD-metalloendopeptidase family protein [Ectothiorhodospiraceae bacterium]
MAAEQLSLALPEAFPETVPATLPQMLPHTAAVPGGVVTLDLGSSQGPAPVAHYNKKRVMVVENNGRWQAVVGIRLTARGGKHQLKITGRKQAVNFKINAKKYAEQRLTIKNKRKVNPNKTDLKRIRGERGRIRKALRHWQQKTNEANVGAQFILPKFILPVTGRLSSPFGLRRFFNKQPRRPHSGIDIAATKGTPIIAPAAGRIIENGNFFFNGNSVFIDHGQGLITMYSHMSRIDIKPGQIVEQGETIGAVGQTGRATGPHLHWSVSLNDARVDPSLFFSDLESLLSAPIKQSAKRFSK